MDAVRGLQQDGCSWGVTVTCIQSGGCSHMGIVRGVQSHGYSWEVQSHGYSRGRSGVLQLHGYSLGVQSHGHFNGTTQHKPLSMLYQLSWCLFQTHLVLLMSPSSKLEIQDCKGTYVGQCQRHLCRPMHECNGTCVQQSGVQGHLCRPMHECKCTCVKQCRSARALMSNNAGVPGHLCD